MVGARAKECIATSAIRFTWGYPLIVCARTRPQRIMNTFVNECHECSPTQTNMPKRRKKRQSASFNYRSHWTPVAAAVVTAANILLLFIDSRTGEKITGQDVGLHLGMFFMAFLLWISNRSDFKDVLSIILDHVPFLRKRD